MALHELPYGVPGAPCERKFPRGSPAPQTPPGGALGPPWVPPPLAPPWVSPGALSPLPGGVRGGQRPPRQGKKFRSHILDRGPPYAQGSTTHWDLRRAQIQLFINFQKHVFDIFLGTGMVSIGFALKFRYGRSHFREIPLNFPTCSKQIININIFNHHR